MKKALIVSSDNSINLINDLPYLLKKGGYHVTVVSFPHWPFTYNSYIDELISAPLRAPEVIEQVADILKTSKKLFDLTILANDLLVWALVESEIETSIKMQLSPIANPQYLNVLKGKIEVAELFKNLNILAPPSTVIRSREEALMAAVEIGFPVMIKVSQSGGGSGAFKFSSLEELEREPIAYTKPLLLEKYIEGDLASIEPLFLNSRLAAYAYSHVVYSPQPFQPSLERIFMPCPEIESTLQKLGSKLQLSGFANLSLIRERSSGKHYLFEFDFRPNRWIRYGTFVGVNWAKALREPATCPLQSPKFIKQFCHFPIDLQHAIHTKNKTRIFYWILNRNGCWKSIPLYDAKQCFYGFWRLLRRILISLFHAICNSKFSH